MSDIRCAAVLVAFSGMAGAFGQELRWTTTGGPRAGLAMVDLDAGGEHRLVACARDRVFERTSGTWIEITENAVPPGDRLAQVVISGGREFLVTSFGEVRRRTDEGWIGVGLPIPNDPTLTLADGGGVLWLVHNPFLPVVTNVFRSTDAGETWAPVSIPEGEFVGEIRVVEGVVLAIRPFGGGYLRSEDNGATWHASGDDAPDVLAGGPVIVGSEWIVPGSPQSAVSVDRGVTWTLRNSSGIVGSRAASDGRRIMTLVNGGVSTTEDGGRTWEVRSGNGLPRCLEGTIQELRAEASGFVVATPTGVYRTIDGGRSWVSLNDGLMRGSATVLAAGESLHAASISLARTFRLEAQGWVSVTDGVPACAQPLALHAEGETVYVGTVYDGISRSVDGGRTFSPLNAGIPVYNGTGGNQLREIGAIARHEGRLLAGTWFGTEFFNQAFQHSGGGMLRLNDAGTGWQQINRGFPIMARNLFNQPVYDPVVSVSDARGPWGRLVLVGTFRNGPVRSVDRGENWAISNAGLPRDPNGFPPMMNDFAVIGGAILAGAIGFPIFADPNGIDRGVFVSRDGGLNWTPAEINTARFAPVNALAVFEGVAYAGADGVYRSTDEGRTWARVPGGPTGEILDLAVHNGGLHAIVRDELGSEVWVGRPACTADFDGDGFVDFLDLASFVACFEGEACPPGATADLDGDGFVDFLDYAAFVEAFDAGC
jgi:photosystem II stability/assembly factor-like uncharacterized protein